MPVRFDNWVESAAALSFTFLQGQLFTSAIMGLQSLAISVRRAIITKAPLIGVDDKLAIRLVQAPCLLVIVRRETDRYAEPLLAVKLVLGAEVHLSRRCDNIRRLSAHQDIELIYREKEDDADPNRSADRAHDTLELRHIRIHLDAKSLAKLVLAFDPLL